MQLSDFQFDLPQELIARYPLAKRSASRLLCIEEKGQSHKHFNDVIHLLNPGDLLIFNDTKVIPARLIGQKTTGGQVEVLVERILSERSLLAQIRASKSPRMGDYLLFPGGVRLVVTNRREKFYELLYNDSEKSVLEMIENIGQIPLPPYMNRSADDSDKERYQTVYAKHKGSVAAPTAGFHFDEALLQALCAKQIDMGYLTLHIGAGTFSPVRVDDIKQHIMHAEYLEISPSLCAQIKATKARGGRVVAVGTTSLRALETASASGETLPFKGETTIFIYPGYQFHCVDALITNLHLPGSTLLMLVSAFAGYEKVMQAYREAVSTGYRFYSYGDAMWMEKAK